MSISQVLAWKPSKGQKVMVWQRLAHSNWFASWETNTHAHTYTKVFLLGHRKFLGSKVIAHCWDEASQMKLRASACVRPQKSIQDIQVEKQAVSECWLHSCLTVPWAADEPAEGLASQQEWGLSCDTPLSPFSWNQQILAFKQRMANGRLAV